MPYKSVNKVSDMIDPFNAMLAYGREVDNKTIVRSLVLGEITTIFAMLREHRDSPTSIHWPLAVALVVQYMQEQYDLHDLTVNDFLDKIQEYQARRIWQTPKSSEDNCNDNNITNTNNKENKQEENKDNE